jgi:hypothetical protein
MRARSCAQHDKPLRQSIRGLVELKSPTTEAAIGSSIQTI